MKLSRQANLVLNYLRSNPHLTPWQAEGVFHIRRLASRIDELRAAGYEIVKETREDAKGQRYTRYGLTPRQRRAKRPLLEPRRGPTQFRIEKVRAAYLAYCENELGMFPTEAEEEVDSFIKFLQENA